MSGVGRGTTTEKNRRGRLRSAPFVSGQDLPVEQHFVVTRAAAARIVVVRVSSIDADRPAGGHRIALLVVMPGDRPRVDSRRRSRDGTSIGSFVHLGESRRTYSRREDGNTDQLRHDFHGDTPLLFMMTTAVITRRPARGRANV
jgi:hypothetical protein